jgi:CheY-like chemotaxis protein
MAKILYVEDNEDNVYMLRMRLEFLEGFQVLVGNDGGEGVALAERERPDLILMDLNMPVVDGWEATRQLKASPTTRDIPVIALSAHAMAGERERALAAGCDEFETKPLDLDRLVGLIRNVLSRRRAR